MQMKRRGCQVGTADCGFLDGLSRKPPLVTIVMMERFSAVFLSIVKRAGFLLERSI